MPGALHEDRLEDGRAALVEARWSDARTAFEESLAERFTPEAMDGLGRSLWWMGETAQALASRTQAYTAYRLQGRREEASRIALWLTLEYAATPGREALSRGWLRRAEGLANELGDTAAGWFALTLSSLDADPIRMAAHAEEALAAAREHDDPELEIRALARSGLALTLSGRADEGLARLDEAMAAAAAGEASQPEVFAETCCDMVTACEATLDGRRLEQWGREAERFLELRPHSPMLAFCGACCAGVFAARGDLAAAETWLTWTIDKLEAMGHEARCVDPRARLAEIRVAQGRLEEAERLLVGIESRPEAVRPVVAVHVARGELGAAVALLHRRVAKVGTESAATIPLLTLLLPIQIERGDLKGAIVSAQRIGELATRVGYPQHLAAASLARGRVALARGDPDTAVDELATAVETYDRSGMPIEAARSLLLLAEAMASTDPEQARVEARSAAARFDAAGLRAEADRADGLVRSLGGRGLVGPKHAGSLTRREQEVLGLVAEGLTNAEIAERLFISTKTVGNHVSSVLTKLNLRSRTEAAVYLHRRHAG